MWLNAQTLPVRFKLNTPHSFVFTRSGFTAAIGTAAECKNTETANEEDLGNTKYQRAAAADLAVNAFADII